MRLKHDYAAAWTFRGLVLEELGRYQEAVESYDHALKHKPDDDLALGNRIETLRTLEKWVRERLPPKPLVDAFEIVAFVEERLHIFIRQRLQQAFGKEETEWWTRGVPLTIRQKCAQRREEDPRREPPYNQTDLLDLKDIMDKNWQHFEADFQKVKGQFKSKKQFLGNLERLNEIRKTVMHPVRGNLTEADRAFADQMREVVESVTPPG